MAIIVLLLLVVVNALELLPAASAFQLYFSAGAVALSLVALIAIVVEGGPAREFGGTELFSPQPRAHPQRPRAGPLPHIHRRLDRTGCCRRDIRAGRFPDADNGRPGR